MFIVSLDFFTCKNRFFLFLCKKKDLALYHFTIALPRCFALQSNGAKQHGRLRPNRPLVKNRFLFTKLPAGGRALPLLCNAKGQRAGLLCFLLIFKQSLNISKKQSKTAKEKCKYNHKFQHNKKTF